jgi:hypothetical protein
MMMMMMMMMILETTTILVPTYNTNKPQGDKRFTGV